MSFFPKTKNMYYQTSRIGGTWYLHQRKGSSYCGRRMQRRMGTCTQHFDMSKNSRSIVVRKQASDINIIAYSLLGVTAATGIFNLGMIVKVCCDERRESKRLRKIERNQKKQKKQLKQSMNKISLT